MLTRKEKEKKLIECLELRTGDIVKVYRCNGIIEYQITELEDYFELRNSHDSLYIEMLCMCDFEVVEYHQKTYGEYKCKEIHCAECPLKLLNCRMDKIETTTLYECLNLTIEDHDSKIYKAFCDELDKIVEDESEILEDDK